MSHHLLCFAQLLYYHIQPAQIFLLFVNVCVCVLYAAVMVDVWCFCETTQRRSVPHTVGARSAGKQWAWLCKNQQGFFFFCHLCLKATGSSEPELGHSGFILHVCFRTEKNSCGFSENGNFPYGINKAFVHPSISQECLERMIDSGIFVNPQT